MHKISCTGKKYHSAVRFPQTIQLHQHLEGQQNYFKNEVSNLEIDISSEAQSLLYKKTIKTYIYAAKLKISFAALITKYRDLV